MSGSWIIVLAALGVGGGGRLLTDIGVHLQHAWTESTANRSELAAAHAELVAFPDGIRISLEPADGARERSARRAVVEAAAMWGEALDRPDLFRFEGEAGNAAVAIRLVRAIDGYPNAAGFARWNRRVCRKGDRVLESRLEADVQVRLGRFEVMRQAAAHELGHVLGLKDSPLPGTVMGPIDLRHPTQTLAEADREALASVMRSAMGYYRRLIGTAAGV